MPLPVRSSSRRKRKNAAEERPGDCSAEVPAPLRMKLRVRRRDNAAAEASAGDGPSDVNPERSRESTRTSSRRKTSNKASSLPTAAASSPPSTSSGSARAVLAAEETSPDSKCPICLDRFNNLAYLDHCLHRFCFPCIQEWSHNKAECPLCKQPFASILHSVRAEDDFKEYTLQPPPTNSSVAATVAMLTGFQGVAAPLDPSDRASRRLMSRLVARQRLQREGGAIRQLREREALAFRRMLYRCGIRVRGVAGANGNHGPQCDITAENFRQNPTHLNRLRPWLQRELKVLYGSHGSLVDIVQRIIVSRLARHGLESPPALEEDLRPFLLARTEHFLHELASFARSPLSMDAYDLQAVYEPPPTTTELGELSSSSDGSSVIAISEEEEEEEEKDQRCLSVWDDETPGPSYSIAEPSSSLAPPPSSSPAPPEAASAGGEDGEREEECLIVGYKKPMAERTPELVQLSSDSEEEEGEKEEVTAEKAPPLSPAPSSSYQPVVPPSTSGAHRVEEIPPTPTRSPSERPHHADKPGGKRKYKSRHLDSGTKDPSWRPNGGRRDRRRRRMEKPRKDLQESSGLGEQSRRRSREDRSPSVEIIYEGTISSRTSRSPAHRRHRKRHRRTRHSSPPVIITLDSDSSHEDVGKKTHSGSSSPLSSQQTIDFSDLPPLPLVPSAGVSGALDPELGELPAEILDRGSDRSDVGAAGPSATGQIHINSDESDVDVENLEDEDSPVELTDKQASRLTRTANRKSSREEPAVVRRTIRDSPELRRASPSDGHLLRTILSDLDQISAARRNLDLNSEFLAEVQTRTSRDSQDRDFFQNRKGPIWPMSNHTSHLNQEFKFSVPLLPPLERLKDGPNAPPLCRRTSPNKSHSGTSPLPLRHKDTGGPQQASSFPRDLQPVLLSAIPSIDTLKTHLLSLRGDRSSRTPPSSLRPPSEESGVSSGTSPPPVDCCPVTPSRSMDSTPGGTRTRSPARWVLSADLRPSRCAAEAGTGGTEWVSPAGPRLPFDPMSSSSGSGGQMDKRTAEILSSPEDLLNHKALPSSPPPADVHFKSNLESEPQNHRRQSSAHNHLADPAPNCLFSSFSRHPPTSDPTGASELR
uniref:E3 ubiquitin-protein ligase Topors n=1 Tax=Nothobranchius rachovii TaxID=451742 RepID=A0A1A8NMG5_9TELE